MGIDHAPPPKCCPANRVGFLGQLDTHEAMVVNQPDMSPDDEAAHAVGRSGPRATTVRRYWPVLRMLVGLGAVGIALWVLDSHTDELSGLPGVLEHLNWVWILTAIAAEMMSFICFAGMQYALLKRGGLQAPKGSLLKVTFAAQALTSSLPGGVAVAAVYGFRWFRRFERTVPWPLGPRWELLLRRPCRSPWLPR